MEDNNSKQLQWYVMEHLNPRWIDYMLHREQRGELTSWDRQPATTPEPFDYFVPYQFMRPDTSNDIREIFHSFVFIKASGERLRSIMQSDWNTKARLHLRYYRDKARHNITISDEEMRQLRATIINTQLKVYFGLPIESIGEMAVGDHVTLLIKDWKGKQGKIESLKMKKGRISMTVGVDILGHTRSVHFENLHDGDVIFTDHDTEQLLTGNIIHNIEGPIATMLGHFFSKDNAEQMRRDYPRLNRFLSYANIQVEDTDDKRRFTSLMLMCATMLHEDTLAQQYAAQISKWLGSRTDAQSLPDVYMMLALFVHHRSPEYRDAVKAYRKDHPECPDIIGTMINKVRDIKTRKRGSH